MSRLHTRIPKPSNYYSVEGYKGELNITHSHTSSQAINNDPRKLLVHIETLRKAIQITDSVSAKQLIRSVKDHPTAEPFEKLQSFSGGLDESAEDFIAIVKKQTRIVGLSEPVLLRCLIPGKLHGEAGKWFQNRMGLSPFRDWADFRSSLIEQFAPTQWVKFKNTGDTNFSSVVSSAAFAEEVQGEKNL